MSNKILYGSNHYQKRESILFAIILSILFLYSIFIFGFHVLLVALVSYATMFGVEFVFQKTRKKEVGFSVLYLPMIFTLLLPPTIPLWIVFVGAFFISFFGKGIFGGDTKYVIHPVVAGMLFITISFPTFLGPSWLDPVTNDVVVTTSINSFNAGTLDISLWDTLSGLTAGAIGTTSRLVIILLAGGLFFFKLVDYKIVLSYLGSTLLFTLLIGLILGNDISQFYMSILVGNVLFVSVFVATDPPTTPLYPGGKIFYGIGLGLLTVLIRVFSAFPEGALFAVVIMNAVAPLFDQGGDDNE
jgi:Na+-transporting NADH:ubiquinone oxidoreductase subunit B/electron transport complex protein RnfD